MDVQVEQTDETTRTFTVTVPADTVQIQMADELKKAQKTHKQRGFRPGRVPMGIIRKRFGAQVKGMVLEGLLRSSLNEVLAEQEGIVHVSNPEMLSKNEEKEGFQYRFDAESLPVITPANYLGVEVRRPAVTVTDEDVDARLEGLRTAYGVETEAERQVVEDGDIILYDGVAVDDGAESSALEILTGEANKRTVNDDPWGFSKGVVGLTVGEPSEIEVGGADDEPQQLRVTVRSIFTRVLPELDDELAKKEGRFETLAELREAHREALTEEQKAHAQQTATTNMNARLIELNPFEIPKGFLEQRVAEELEQTLYRLTGQRVNPATLGLATDSLKDQMRPDVERGLKESLLLEAIMKAEEITVDDEALEARITEVVAEQKDPAQQDAAKQHYRNDGNREHLRSVMQLEATVEMLLAKAVVVEYDPAEEVDEVEAASEGGEDEGKILDSEPAPSAEAVADSADAEE